MTNPLDHMERKAIPLVITGQKITLRHSKVRGKMKCPSELWMMTIHCNHAVELNLMYRQKCAYGFLFWYCYRSLIEIW